VTALGVTPCAASDAGAWAARTPYTLSTKARPRTSAQRRHRRFQPARGEGLCFSLPLLDRAAQTQEEAHPLRPLPSLPCRRAAATRAPNGASEGRLNWAASSPPPRAIGSSQATAGTSAGSPTSATSGTLTTPTRSLSAAAATSGAADVPSPLKRWRESGQARGRSCTNHSHRDLAFAGSLRAADLRGSSSVGLGRTERCANHATLGVSVAAPALSLS
jgi:hypothetical protein